MPNRVNGKYRKGNIRDVPGACTLGKAACRQSEADSAYRNEDSPCWANEQHNVRGQLGVF